jgi:anti-anti-sigma factor
VEKSRNVAARAGRYVRNRFSRPSNGEPEVIEVPVPTVEEQLGVEVSRSNGCVRVSVTGELDLLTAEPLTARLREVEAEDAPTLELDIRDLSFLDSTGIALLFATNRRAREAGRRLVLLKGPGPIERVLALAHVEDVIDTVEEPRKT